VNRLYRLLNRFARSWRIGRLERWTYLKWFSWWMKKDPALGYWRFSAEYLGGKGGGEAA